MARTLGEPRGHFSGGSRQNCEGTPRAAKGRVAACRLRGEWPKAKVSREGSTLPAAGASTGQHPRAPRLRVPERRRCLSGPRPLSAQPGRPRRPRLETPSGWSWLYPRYRRHSSPLPGPAYFFPVRICDARPHSHCPSARSFPEFRISGSRVSLATRAARLSPLHHFACGHLE